MHVAADPCGKIVAIGFAQGIDPGVTVFAADLTVRITMAAIQARLLLGHGEMLQNQGRESTYALTIEQNENMDKGPVGQPSHG